MNDEQRQLREKLILGLAEQAELMRRNADLMELFSDEIGYHALQLRGAAKITDGWIEGIENTEL